MPKHLIRRYLPHPDRIIHHPALSFMSHRLADPNLWHLNRHSAAGAAFWGLWCAMLPIPLQMLPATALAIFFRVNLPLSIVLCWTSNPLTAIPLIWLAYFVGSLLLGVPMLDSMELRVLLHDLGTVFTQWFSDSAGAASPHLAHYLGPLLLGTVVTGFLLGCMGYVMMRLFWRWHVLSAWRKRKAKRLAASFQ